MGPVLSSSAPSVYQRWSPGPAGDPNAICGPDQVTQRPGLKSSASPVAQHRGLLQGLELISCATVVCRGLILITTENLDNAKEVRTSLWGPKEIRHPGSRTAVSLSLSPSWALPWMAALFHLTCSLHINRTRGKSLCRGGPENREQKKT